jgi:Zn-dependent M28 family amino/carboxypeptidase
MKKLLFIIVCLFATSVFGQAPELRETVTKLSSLSRVSGTKGCNEAADYLTTRLSGLGYPVEAQEFTYGRWTASNILATKTAALDTVIVIGAHYDAVRGTPGADDNASGTASVLLLAKMLKDIPTRHTISFQLYAGEEQQLIGSKFYCDNPKWPIDKHLFMLNIDMIGYLKAGLTAPVQIESLLKPLFQKYPFANQVTLRNDPGSDNASFLEKKIPAIFLHTGLHRNYHKASDTADKLNYEGMAEICKYALEVVLVVDKYDVPNYLILDGLPVVRMPR